MIKKKTKKLKAVGQISLLSFYEQVDTPVGCLTLIANKLGLSLILWEEKWVTKHFLENQNKLIHEPQNPHLLCAKKQLHEYFSGTRKKFSVKISAAGTDFQKKAWTQLLKIPYGQTISYQQQAIALGNKNKVRAVGSANGRNPISIIVPCHRVIAKDGSLSGFGGGVNIKRFLLEHEQKFS